MKAIRSGKSGLAGIVLVIVIVWALAAVLMLTGTLVAARSINDDVGIIRPEVSDIFTDTKFVALAGKTEKISGRISKAAKPLIGRARSTLAAAKQIDVTAKSILRRARTINGTVGQINGNVLGIGTTVSGIGGSFNGISSSVAGIGASAQGINTSVRSINATARQVNDDVRSIRSRLGAILDQGGSIDVEVAGINRRAETIQGIGRSLGGDLNEVREKFVPSIDTHANSIDCSNLLNLLGPTMNCVRTRGAANPRPEAFLRVFARNGNRRAMSRAIQELLYGAGVPPTRVKTGGRNNRPGKGGSDGTSNSKPAPSADQGAGNNAGAGPGSNGPAETINGVARTLGAGLDATNGSLGSVGRAINGLLSLG